MPSSKSDLKRDFAAALYLTENPPLPPPHTVQVNMYIGKGGGGEVVVKKRRGAVQPEKRYGIEHRAGKATASLAGGK
jgi:hypothetical protein